MRAIRVGQQPVVHPGLDPSLGDNINGPSLIRVPEWIERPLGRYYLYFAHHRDSFIRLAHADRLEGPWSIHSPGALDVEISTCLDHVASPDLHASPSRRELWMYFHGVTLHDDTRPDPHRNAIDTLHPIVQRTKLATSSDGLRFRARGEVLGPSYFRVFRWRDSSYALAMPGLLYRSEDGITGFVRGPQLFGDDTRHCAVCVRDETLHVFFSRAGDCPESILHATVALEPDWREWHASEPRVLLEPELAWEGAELSLAPSERGQARGPLRQLRDPAVFEDEGETYLLYSGAGESGIGIARLEGL